MTIDQKQAKKGGAFRLTPWLWPIIAAFITAVLLFYYNDKKETEQSLTYFPDDPTLTFTKSQTDLTLNGGKLEWLASSKTDQPVYLRQDVSLLFKNNKLIGMLSTWDKETDGLVQEQTLPIKKSGGFEAITIHHAETHYPGDSIKGKATMSYDHLYIMSTPQGFQSFKVPVTPDETAWFLTFKKTERHHQEALLKKAAEKYHLRLNNYSVFPLTYLHVYDQNPLPGLDQKTSHRVISQLWEGLYKHFLLGFHGEDGRIKKPIGSMTPLILYNKRATDILVVIETTSEEILLLKQTI